MLRINMEFRKGLLFIRLKGELSENNSKRLEQYLNSIVTENGIKYLVLNFNEVEKVEEQGINTIFNCYQDIIMNNGKLVLCGYKKLNNNILTSDLFQDIYKSNTELGAFKLINI